MTVTRNENNDIVVILPGDMDIDDIKRTLDLLKYKESTRNSEATQELANELAREAKKGWWERNKHRIFSKKELAILEEELSKS